MSSDNSPTSSVKIDGAQVVRNIQATHERLCAAIAEHPAVEVDCAGVTEFDLSLIQLLLAAKRSAESSGKTLSLAVPVAGQLRAALERTGFLDAASGQSEAAVFWLKGSVAS